MLSQQNTEDYYRSLRGSVDSSVYSDFNPPTAQIEEPPVNPENPPINLEDFDLLAGHDFGNTQVIPAKRNEEPQKILVWHKLETTGFQPAARQRVNSTITLELNGRNWTYNECKGSLPSPRSYHAACCINDLMIIHGGEGVKPPSSDLVTEPTKVDSSLSIEQPNNNVMNRTVAKMKGVCPGDNLTEGKLKSALKVKHANQFRNPVNGLKPLPTNVTPTQSLLDTVSLSEAASIVTCLEDMYALDTITYTWYSIPCALSPLARKGHSLNTCYLSPISSSSNPYPGTEKVLTMIMFGGYSLENLTVSNSLFICEAPQVEKCHQQLKLSQLRQQQEILQLVNDQKLPNQQRKSQPSVDPIIWKAVTCRGSAPSPRYRHSSCIVPGNSGESLLVIMGGIGKDPKVALSDIYILDIQNWTWITLAHGNDCLAQGLGGVGPAAGIYGHIAVPVAKINPKSPEEIMDERDGMVEAMNLQYEMIIFGGSANTLSLHSNCYSSMFAFDLSQHQWKRVETGHSFPTSRCNHSAVMVENWSLSHNLSYQKTLSQHDQQGMTAKIDTTTDSVGLPSNYRASAIIFGGVSATKGQADTWVLDCRYKAAGIHQYDNNIEQLIQENIQQTNHYYQDTLFLASSKDDPLFLSESPILQLGKSFSTSHLPPSSQKQRFQATNNKKYLQSYFNVTSANGRSLRKQVGRGANTDSPSAGPVDRTTVLEGTEVMTEANSTFAGIPIVDEIYIPSADDEYEASFVKNIMRVSSQQGGDLSLVTPGGRGKESEVNELILKLRKERALTSIQLQQEKNENTLLNEKIHLLTDELTKTQQTMVAMKNQYEQEMKELKKLLIESQRRENMLKQLNQETLQLLQLNGVDQINSPQTLFPFTEK